MVRPNDPEHISLLSLAPASLNTAKFSVDDAERSRVIEGAAKLLVKVYVLPNVATNLALALKKAGHEIVQIYNRSDDAGKELAHTVAASFTSALDEDCDFLRDAAIPL